MGSAAVRPKRARVKRWGPREKGDGDRVDTKGRERKLRFTGWNQRHRCLFSYRLNSYGIRQSATSNPIFFLSLSFFLSNHPKGPLSLQISLSQSSRVIDEKNLHAMFNLYSLV